MDRMKFVSRALVSRRPCASVLKFYEVSQNLDFPFPSLQNEVTWGSFKILLLHIFPDSCSVYIEC